MANPVGPQPLDQRILIDGEWRGHISVRDRGFAFGDGLFETLLVVNGRCPLLEFHFKRLFESAAALGIPLNQARIRSYFERYLDGFNSSGLDKASSISSKLIIKLTVTRGVGGEGYVPPSLSDAEPCVIIAGRGFSPSFSKTVLLQESKVALGVNRYLAGHKHLSCLEYVLAAKEQKCSESQPLLLSCEGDVIEALHYNIFWVKDGEIFTPKLDHCGVAGVMRNFLLDKVIPALRVPSNIIRAGLDELVQADEIFLCNSVRGILPVAGLNQYKFEVGVVTSSLQQRLSSMCVGAYD